MKKIINKKIILIGTLILIAIIALVNIYNDLGKNTSFEIENYKITLKDLKAKKLGINSKYTAEFSNYNFIDMTKETFYVDFIDISDEIIINSLDNEDTLKTIKIGNKKFKYYFDNKDVIFIKKDGIIADEEIVSIIHFDLVHKTMMKYKTKLDFTSKEEDKALLKAEKELGW